MAPPGQLAVLPGSVLLDPVLVAYLKQIGIMVLIVDIEGDGNVGCLVKRHVHTLLLLPNSSSL